ncbi:hypothetical protein GIB67_030651 [Kingdonia uniflora]|uniref:Zinc finger GRF-type domain-containing protein n=1 Tax=Kingdonia uniflora TaxID=39325 RepID=A0A7J7NJ85_9MAGN|nr:hypothetical protein GIB67_030651 [Kingdonia uniflora]
MDYGFWCWVDEYLPCSCGYSPCKLRSAISSKKRFYCCPLSKSKQERGCGFLKWFDEVNGESSTFTPGTTATPDFTTSTTIEDLEIKYKIELMPLSRVQYPLHFDYVKDLWLIEQAQYEIDTYGTDESGNLNYVDTIKERRLFPATSIVQNSLYPEMSMNSEAKKHKTAPLQHRDLLEKLFDGLSATGDFAWSSGMVSVPPSTQHTEYVPLPDDMNVDDIQVFHAEVDYPWEGEAIPSFNVPISPGREPTPSSTFRTQVSQVGVQTQSKRKRSAATVQPVEPIELVQSLISAFTAQ